jgi:hypothetical protein
MMSRFADTLRTQRFDDYRYYHQSRINQTLHLISAVISWSAMGCCSTTLLWQASSAGSRC